MEFFVIIGLVAFLTLCSVGLVAIIVHLADL